MPDKNSSLTDIFGHKVRVRVCGLHIQNGSVLMVKHKGLGKEGVLWVPPGGGVDFGISAEQSLEREFKEETGLTIKVKDFLFINEFLNPPLHAVELFFEVEVVKGSLFTGIDPELDLENQIIEDVKYLNWSELKELRPAQVHSIFARGSNLEEIINYRGYFLFGNNYIK